MKRIIFILLFPLLASAQVATNRCAIDMANMAESEADYVDSGVYDSTLAGWFCFLVAPTNDTTFASGDSSPLRYTLQQTNVAQRPTWNTNGMTFDGVDDRLYSVGQRTGMWYGVRCWLLLTNSITATNSPRALYSRRAPTSNQVSVVFLGSATGSLTNETITVIADAGDAWRVGITNALSAGWHHLVVTWAATNYSVYLNGARPPHIYNVGTVAGVTNTLEYWVGGNLVSTSSLLNATVDCFVLLSNAWTAAQIGADYTNGLRRRNLP